MYQVIVCSLHSTDVVYIIGGDTTKTHLPCQTHEVIGVNIATREVFEPQDIIHDVIWPAAAASLDKLVVCGGLQVSGCAKYCQLYSPKEDRYARIALCKYFSVYCVP